MIKTIDDYVDIVQKRYPFVKREEVRRIAVYGFGQFNWFARRGYDVIIKNWRYCLSMQTRFWTDQEQRWHATRQKTKSCRLRHRFSKEKYEGCYYIGISRYLFSKYKSDLLNPDKPEITFKNVKLFKCKEECFSQKKYMYFIKVGYPIDNGWMMIKKSFTTKEYKYFAYRNNKGLIKNI